MSFDLLTSLTLVVAFCVFVVHRSVRRLIPIIRTRREQRYLDESGVRTRGVVRSTRPFRRHARGHTVTVDVRDDHGREWRAVDSSGLGGYVIPEGTPVELVHSPDDPKVIRVERAAFPAPGTGSYPLRPEGRPSSGWAALGAVLPSLVVLIPTGAVGVLLLIPQARGDGLVLLSLLSTMLVGAVLLVNVVRLVVASRSNTLRYTGETEGVVTDTWPETNGLTQKGSARYMYPFTVCFRLPDGREVHKRHHLSSSSYRPSVNQRVRVRYDRDHPARFTVQDFSADGTLHALLLFAGVLLILIGVGGVRAVLVATGS